MPIAIEAYTQAHETAVEAFNQRLKAAGNRDLVFYKRSSPEWPTARGSGVRNEYFVAVDRGVVRGAYALKHEVVFVRGKGELAVACYHHPLSEGIVDRAWAAVGGVMIRDALARQPLLYALGMGGVDQALPRMLKVLGWSLGVVPFFFKIVSPSRFLRQIEAIRTSGLRRAMMDAAAFTGAGWLMIRAGQFARQRSARKAEGQAVSEFSDWTDPLWEGARERYRVAACRDSRTLRTLYPGADGHFARLRITKNGDDVGWAVTALRRKDSKYGSLKVGSIVDCWAAPENAAVVMKMATLALERSQMDLLVSNQSHEAWGKALEQCGFFKGPSNFVFAASKKYAEILGPLTEAIASGHITRADGDGLPRNF